MAPLLITLYAHNASTPYDSARFLSIPIGINLSHLFLQGNAALSLPVGQLGRVQAVALMEWNMGGGEWQDVHAFSGCCDLRKLAMSGRVKVDHLPHPDILTHIVLLDKQIFNPPIAQFASLQHLFLGDISSVPPVRDDITLPLLHTLHVGMRGLTAHLVYLFFRHVSMPQLSLLALDCDWLLMTVTMPMLYQGSRGFHNFQTLRLLGPHFDACRIDDLDRATQSIRTLDIAAAHLERVQAALTHDLWTGLERINIVGEQVIVAVDRGELSLGEVDKGSEEQKTMASSCTY